VLTPSGVVLALVPVHVVSNTPPVANNDSYSTNEDVALTVAGPGILGNDTDAESNPLTAILVSGPAHGSVALNANGSFTYTPNANYNGSDSFTYKANDGIDNSNAAAAVSITVNPVNDAPNFTKGADQTVLEDAGAQSATNWATAINAGPADESGQTLTFVVTGNSNPSLFAAGPAISASGTLTYTPAPNANGSSSITLKLTDNGGTANGGVNASAAQTFTITVNPVNHAPSFTKGASPTILEDAGAQSVSGWATNISPGPSNEAAQALDFIVTNDNNALFSTQPSVDATGKLSYTPAPNRNGSATVTVKLHDNGGTANGGVDTSPVQTFTITITPVNDAPTFNLMANNTAAEDAGPQTVNGALTNASPGPFETGQTLTLTVTNANDALFSVQPSIDLSTGTLKYTSAPNANGKATVTVKLQDDGGTANGGVDQTTKTFTITVTPVNDAPVITAFSGPTQLLGVGGSVSVTGTFTDVDLGDTPPDSHTGTIDWGDGTTAPATIASASGNTRNFGGSHTYATAGVYVIEA
jgi:VCBS repeat-containing protein